MLLKPVGISDKKYIDSIKYARYSLKPDLSKNKVLIVFLMIIGVQNVWLVFTTMFFSFYDLHKKFALFFNLLRYLSICPYSELLHMIRDCLSRNGSPPFPIYLHIE